MLRKLNDILSLFTYDQPELTASEIAEILGRPRSTIYRLLARVADEGFLDHDEDTGRYRVGMRLAVLGDLAQRSTTLQRVILPVLQRLSRDLRATATIMVRAGSEGLTIEVVESLQPIMLPVLLGGHLPLHATAGGKVLLSCLTEEQRREVLRPPLKRYTRFTVTNIARLTNELERVCQKGYATVHGDWVEDVWAAAAPLRNHNGDVVGAITVGCTRQRMEVLKMSSMIDAVVAAAAEGSAVLGFWGVRSKGRLSDVSAKPSTRVRAHRGAARVRRRVR